MHCLSHNVLLLLLSLLPCSIEPGVEVEVTIADV